MLIPQIVRLEGLTPLIFIEIDGSDPKSEVNLLMYGHLGTRFLILNLLLLGSQIRQTTTSH